MASHNNSIEWNRIGDERRMEQEEISIYHVFITNIFLVFCGIYLQLSLFRGLLYFIHCLFGSFIHLYLFFIFALHISIFWKFFVQNIKFQLPTFRPFLCQLSLKENPFLSRIKFLMCKIVSERLHSGK